MMKFLKKLWQKMLSLEGIKILLSINCCLILVEVAFVISQGSLEPVDRVYVIVASFYSGFTFVRLWTDL